MSIWKILLGDRPPSAAVMADRTKSLAFADLSYAMTARTPLEVSGDHLARARQERRPRARHGLQRLGKHGEPERLQIAWPAPKRRIGLHAKW